MGSTCCCPGHRCQRIASRPGDVEPASIPPGLYGACVALLAGDHDAVVLHVPRTLGALARTAVRLADDVVLVTGLDLMSLYGARRTIEGLRSEAGGSPIRVVLNLARRPELSPSEVERVLGMKAVARIRSDRLRARCPGRGSARRTSRREGLARCRLAVAFSRSRPGREGAEMTARIDTDRLRGLVRQRLLGADAAVRIGDLSPPQRRLAVRGAVLDVLNEQRVILSEGSLAAVLNDVSDEVVGFGPIERLLKDPEVSEVMVNGADDVYVERKGRVEPVEGLWFEGEAQVLHLIERIVAPLGLRVDESSPYVDARLPDGSRANGLLRNAPSTSIRHAPDMNRHAADCEFQHSEPAHHLPTSPSGSTEGRVRGSTVQTPGPAPAASSLRLFALLSSLAFAFSFGSCNASIAEVVPRFRILPIRWAFVAVIHRVRLVRLFAAITFN